MDVENTKQEAQKPESVVQTVDEINPISRVVKQAEEDRALVKKLVGSNFITNSILLVVFALLTFTTIKAVNPVREYFGLNNGVMIPIVPLGEPYRSPSEVITFARDGLNKTFSLSFTNYRSEFETARPYYSQTGFQSVLNNLEEQGYMQILKEKRMNLTPATGVGVLVRERVIKGIFVRTIEIPLTLSFQGSTNKLPDQPLIAIVTVSRVATSKSADGIEITQVVTRPAGNN
jgi:intracellular multiplication protein IcmL